MYKAVVKSRARKGYAQLSEGRFEDLVSSFASDVRFVFAGDHALAADAWGRERALAWFQRVGRLLPGLQFRAHTIVVDGWPWDTRVATHFTVSATLDGGREYRNGGLQLIRLRWGKVTEDHVYEDTHRVSEALTYLAARGVDEASATPIT